MPPQQTVWTINSSGFYGAQLYPEYEKEANLEIFIDLQEPKPFTRT